MAVKIILLILFFGVMMGIGVYARKHATDVNGFVLGGRSVGPWLTAFAYGTSYFSAVVFVGYAGQFGYKYGLASTWIGIGNAVLGSLVAWVVLGRRTRIMSKHLGSMTMPDFFGKRYDSQSLRIAESVIAFIFLIPYTASVYNGLSYLFGMAFDVDFRICVEVMAVLTGVYVIIGGYMATAWNDLIQGIIMLFGIDSGDRSRTQRDTVDLWRRSRNWHRCQAPLCRERTLPSGTGSGQFVWCSDPYFSGNLGTASDDPEVLCH